MFLAQLQAADPIHIRDFLILIGFLISTGTGVAALVQAGRKQNREVTFGAAYVTKEFCTAQHSETARRLVAADSQLSQIWTTLREEDEKTRAEMHRCFQDIERALGRIEGNIEKLRSKN